MKKIAIYLCLLFITCISCVNEEIIGEGIVDLNVSFKESSIEKIASRSGETNNTTDPIVKDCKIKIRNAAKELIRKYENLSELPNALHLISGNYFAEGASLQKNPVGFDAPYYQGETSFSVKKGETTSTNLVLKLKSTIVKVAYTEKAKNKYSDDCTVTITSSQGSLEFKKGESAKTGYFNLKKGENTLQWVIKGTTIENIPFTKSGTISDIDPSTEYTIQFDYEDANISKGGFTINTVVEKEPLYVEKVMTVFRSPKIQLQNKSILSKITPLNFSLNENADKIEIAIRASSELKNVELSSPALQEVAKLSSSEGDLITMSENVRKTWEDKGIVYASEYDTESETTSAKITFTESFLNLFTHQPTEKTYTLKLKVEDKNQRVSKADIVINVSNSIVTTKLVNAEDIWPKKALLKADLNKKLFEGLAEDKKELAFEYREQGQSNWTRKIIQANSTNELELWISDLKPATTYEYRVYCKGQTNEAKTYTLTTEAATPLQNGGFDENHLESGLQEFFKQGGKRFWDTGNHGSMKMSKNISTYDTNVKAPTGDSKGSIKMQSQFIGIGIFGAFAAGNVFTGEFLRTEGTNGILAFGRPFVSRPTKLKGYIKYISTPINYVGSTLPEGKAKKGDADKGIIYIALGDWDNESTKKDSPILISTKAPVKTFNPKDAHVIAYGEYITSSTTSGEQMIPFEINLKYNDLHRIPKFIAVVASSSIYGDYFTGGNGSTLWLDNLELVYE